MKTCAFLVLGMLVAAAAAGADERAAQGPRVGGYSAASVTNAEVVAAADFAIKAEEKVLRKDNPAATLTLVKILGAQQQVVAGMNYRMDLKVRMDGTEKEAEAVVWWQAWNRQEPYKLTSWTWK